MLCKTLLLSAFEDRSWELKGATIEIALVLWKCWNCSALATAQCWSSANMENFQRRTCWAFTQENQMLRRSLLLNPNTWWIGRQSTNTSIVLSTTCQIKPIWLLFYDKILCSDSLIKQGDWDISIRFLIFVYDTKRSDGRLSYLEVGECNNNRLSLRSCLWCTFSLCDKFLVPMYQPFKKFESKRPSSIFTDDS